MGIEENKNKYYQCIKIVILCKQNINKEKQQRVVSSRKMSSGHMATEKTEISLHIHVVCSVLSLSAS